MLSFIVLLGVLVFVITFLILLRFGILVKIVYPWIYFKVVKLFPGFPGLYFLLASKDQLDYLSKFLDKRFDSSNSSSEYRYLKSIRMMLRTHVTETFSESDLLTMHDYTRYVSYIPKDRLVNFSKDFKIKHYKYFDSEQKTHISSNTELTRDELLSLKHDIKLSYTKYFRNYRDKYVHEEDIRDFGDKLPSFLYEQHLISDDLMWKYKDILDLHLLSQNQRLSPKFIDWIVDSRKLENGSVINLIEYQVLNMRQMNQILINEKNLYKEFFNSMIKKQQLTDDFLIENFNLISNYKILAQNQKLGHKFLKFYSKMGEVGKLETLSILKSLCQFSYNAREVFEKIEREIKDHYISLIDMKRYQCQIFAKKSLAMKRREMIEYATRWNLKFENDTLYAFRENAYNRGIYCKSMTYESGKSYRDWRCNMDPHDNASFGLGIWGVNKGIKNAILVAVNVKDWGCDIPSDKDGKARVFGFTVISEGSEIFDEYSEYNRR